VVIAFQDHIEQLLDDNGDLFCIRPGDSINLTHAQGGNDPARGRSVRTARLGQNVDALERKDGSQVSAVSQF